MHFGERPCLHDSFLSCWKENFQNLRHNFQNLNDIWLPNYLCLKQTKKSNYKSSKNTFGGFPGGAVVENLPANARDTGSSPGLGRSHMPRSGWAREPQLLSLRIWSLCSTT